MAELLAGAYPPAVDSLPTPASVRHRLFARVMDAITLTWLLGFVLVEIDQRLLGGDPFGRQPLQIDITEGRSLVFVIVTIAAYEVIPTVWRGATLGKALLGLRIQTIEPQASMPWIRSSARFNFTSTSSSFVACFTTASLFFGSLFFNSKMGELNGLTELRLISIETRRRRLNVCVPV